MKKIRVAMIALLTLLIGSVLVACNFKEPEINFSQEEVLVSVGDSLNLKDYLSIREANEKQISFRFENKNLFDVKGDIVTARASGKSNVYACFNENIFSSMQIVVKQKFSTPTNFVMSDSGVVSWDKSFAIYQDETNPTFAKSYVVAGTFTSYESDNPETVKVVKQISSTCEGNSFTLEEEGVYNLTFTAVGYGAFDTSDVSSKQNFSFGYMEKLTINDISWSTDGELSWKNVANAKYKVVLDGSVDALGDFQEKNSKILSEKFSSLSEGEHTLAIFLYDKTGEKMAMKSEEIVVTKLAKADVQYNYNSITGGEIVISSQNGEDVKQYDVVLSGQNEYSCSMNSLGQEVHTYFDELDCGNGVQQVQSGLYQLKVTAVPVEGNFFRSDVIVKSVYKLEAPTVAGRDGNEVDGFEFNLTASIGTPVGVESKLSVNCDDTNSVFSGIVANGTSSEFEYEVFESGVYVLKAKQIASRANNTLSGDEVYVLNSVYGNSLSLTKLDEIGEIVHSVVGEKSVFSFDKVENTSTYKLMVFDGGDYSFVNDDLYNLNIEGETVKFVLNDKIENMEFYQNGRKFEFMIVAKTEDNLVGIDSSREKVVTELALTSKISREETNLTYSWVTVANVSQYKIDVYEIDKDTFDANDVEIDVSSIENLGTTTSLTNYRFEKEGYYLVKIQSLTGDLNNYISSTRVYKDLVCVSKVLDIGNVVLGYNGEKYFVQLQNLDNIDKFKITLNGQAIINQIVDEGEQSSYLLAQLFEDSSKEYVLTAVACSNDSRLYLDSVESSLTVKRLPVVSYEDIEISDMTFVSNENFVASAKSQEISVSANYNASGIQIWESLNANNKAGGKTASEAVYDLETRTNIDLCFKYFGSAQSTQNNNIFVSQNGRVYLDGETATYNISRLSTPTELAFYNGELSFENQNTALTTYYIVTIVCKDSNNKTKNIVAKLSNEAKISYLNNEENFGDGTRFVTVASGTNNVSIDILSLVEAVQEVSNVEILQAYTQATSYGFAISCYVYREETSGIIIASNYASNKEDSSSCICIVEKMDEPEVSYQTTDTNIQLSWNAVSTNPSVANETTYQIFVNNEEYGSEISGSTTVSYSLSEFDLGKYYSFKVVAENPYYLDSNDSKIVRIFRLNAIPTLKLISEGVHAGKLEYQLSSAEREFNEYVLINNDEHNTTGKIEIGEKSSVSLQVIGKKDIESDNMVTSYLDSAVTSWDLAKMSTLKATDEIVTFDNNVISWNGFATEKNLTTMSYVLVFSDGENIALYNTKETQVLLTDSVLLETVSRLNEGEISIALYSKLDTYSTTAGKTIYYADSIQLENESNVVNYHKYESVANMKKLSTPNVENVSYVVASDLSDVNTPTIRVTFVGNYGDQGTFLIWAEIGGEKTDLVCTKTIVKNDEEKYVFDLTPSDYGAVFKAGDEITIKIIATSESDIPSSFGSVAMACANEIDSAQLLDISTTSPTGIISKTLRIETKDQDHIAGGFALKIVYTAKGEAEKVKIVSKLASNNVETWECDIANELETLLPNGGTFKIGVIAQSYSKDGTYYLACPTYVETEEYSMLDDIRETDIVKYSGGFIIDNYLNNESTIYVVRYGAKEYEVNIENGICYFEFDPTWENGTYDLKVYAKEEGYVSSKINTMSFTLSRLNPITSVSVVRDSADLSNATISWNEIEGAEGYIFRVYNANKTRIIFEKEIESNSTAVSNVLGEEFFNEYGYVFNDLDIKIGITAIGVTNSSNNSKEFYAVASVCGINFETEDVYVNEFGIVEFKAEVGKTYLYRFVDSTSSPVCEWREVVAESDVIKLDASEFNETLESGNNADGSLNLELKIVGDESSLEFDSQKFSTSGQYYVTFVLNEPIVSIGYEAQNPTGLSFTLVTDGFEKLYYGIHEEDLINGNVLSVVPTFVKEVDSKTSIYSCELIDILLAVSEKYELNSFGDIKLYFWSYRSDSVQNNCYINSPSGSYTIEYFEEVGFREIKKTGVDSEGLSQEDFANSYALFDNSASTLIQNVGILVRVKNAGAEKIVLVDATTLSESALTSDATLALNLSKMIENTPALENMYGEIEIEFAKVMINLLQFKFRISQWSDKFDLYRLQNVESVSVSGGALRWRNVDDRSTKYYVYLINEEALEGEHDFYKITQNTQYILMDVVDTIDKFYVAVQAINEDNNVLPSKKIFVMKGEELALLIKKQISSELKLSEGRLYFEWDLTGDFCQYLENSSGATGQEATELLETTFFSPFTFTFSDLLNDNIKLRLRFSNIETNKYQTFDINAKYFLENLFKSKELYKEKLSGLMASATTTSEKRLIGSFIELMENAKAGVGNSNILLDEYLEQLQVGRYKFEYSLIGVGASISSEWKIFQNSVDKQEDRIQGLIYVSGQPDVFVQKQESLESVGENAYRLFIKISKLYDYVDENYVSVDADCFVMKLYDPNDKTKEFVFDIQSSGSGYSVSLRGVDGETVGAQRCNVDGTADEVGEYLMFYLNQNGGNSLLGIYGDEISREKFNFQIFAVGNNVSTSSKSEVFKLTFLGFDSNLKMVNGAFVWTTQMNRNATVVYKKQTSTRTEVKVIDGSESSLSFGLEENGSGLYDFIKFVTVGEVSGNEILVDSDIYILENVYKLSAPAVTNSLGRIKIDNQTNFAALQENLEGYTSEEFSYRIYNNVSTKTLYNTILDDSLLYYEPGATGVAQTNADYDYRTTESTAEKFYISVTGTSANFGFEKDEYDYFIKYIKLEGENQFAIVSSQSAEFNAQMMNKVSGVKVVDGVLTWAEVDKTDGLDLNDRTSVVYKVSVRSYQKTGTDSGVEKTYSSSYEFYTTKTTFDFANIDVEEVNYPNFEVTVQALALMTARVKPSYISDEDCVTSTETLGRKFLDGGVAYGSVQYSGTNKAILIGEGSVVDGIERTKSIDDGSLKVDEGKLTWTYTLNKTEVGVVDAYNILNGYTFSVLNSDLEEVQGEFEVVNDKTVVGESTVTFSIVFTEEKGQLESGRQTLYVYAAKKDDKVLFIKSLPRSIELTKVRAIGESDFVIRSTSNPSVEELDLSNYFTEYENANVKLKIYFTETNYEEFVFDKDDCKLYILSGDVYINSDKKVLMTTGATLRFEVTVSDENHLYSDISDDIVLQRAEWQDEEIVWDDERDMFTWTYSGNFALQQDVVAAKIDGSETILPVGTLYKVKSSDEETESSETTTIIVSDEEYVISTEYVIGPTFIVDAQYGTGSGAITRTYTTSTYYFAPTIVGDVTISVRVKLGATNIQSQSLRYLTTAEESSEGAGQVKFESFDLFAFGDGTLANPYIIDTEMHFKNMQYRMQKESYLFTYSQNGSSFNEEEVYYFRLSDSFDGTISSFAGVLLQGTFYGVLDGNGKTIAYTVGGLEKMEESITVPAGYLSSSANVFEYGASIFATLGSSAIVKNLNISVSYANFNTTRPAVLAGLAITNNGQLSNVNLVELESAITGSSSGRLLPLMYSGLVTRNIGASALISNCKNLADISISTNNADQLVCISGIASLNYASIEDCENGKSEGTETQIGVSSEYGDSKIEIAGIAIINATNATIKNCKNYAKVSLYTESGNWDIYVAGIVVSNDGRLQNNENLNYNVEVDTVSGANSVQKGEITIE